MPVATTLVASTPVLEFFQSLVGADEFKKTTGRPVRRGNCVRLLTESRELTFSVRGSKVVETRTVPAQAEVTYFYSPYLLSSRTRQMAFVLLAGGDQLQLFGDGTVRLKSVNAARCGNGKVVKLKNRDW